MAESKERDDLRYDEKENDVNSQQLTEIPRRGVYRPAIGKKNQASDDKKSNTRGELRALKPGANNGIATGFEYSGGKEDQERERSTHAYWLTMFCHIKK